MQSFSLLTLPLYWNAEETTNWKTHEAIFAFCLSVCGSNCFTLREPQMSLCLCKNFSEDTGALFLLHVSGDEGSCARGAACTYVCPCARGCARTSAPMLAGSCTQRCSPAAGNRLCGAKPASRNDVSGSPVPLPYSGVLYMDPLLTRTPSLPSAISDGPDLATFSYYLWSRYPTSDGDRRQATGGKPRLESSTASGRLQKPRQNTPNEDTSVLTPHPLVRSVKSVDLCFHVNTRGAKHSESHSRRKGTTTREVCELVL